MREESKRENVMCARGIYCNYVMRHTISCMQENELKAAHFPYWLFQHKTFSPNMSWIMNYI